MRDFSIIIPCHNYGRFLKTTIDSILCQTLQNYEIIVVDDASTDDTSKVVRAYGDNIKYVHLKQNVGPGAAWIEGLKHINGKFICKLDADDWLLNDFLLAAKKAFATDQDIGAVIASVYEYQEGEEHAKLFSVTTTDKTLNAHEFRMRLLKGFFLRMPGTVLRHEAIKDTGPPLSELYIGHDWEYFLRISKKWKSFLLKKPGAVYRQHSNSVTKNASINNRIMKDFKFWLDVSSKKETPYYISEKKKKRLALSIAQTYLKLQSIPKRNILLYYRFMLYFLNAGRLVVKVSPSVLLPLTGFIVVAVAKSIGRGVKITKEANHKKGNEITHIINLLPKPH